MIKLFSTYAEQSLRSYYYLINSFTYKLAILTIALFTHKLTYSQGVSINTTGNAGSADAMLDISSTTSGLLIPRMTQAQRNAINSGTFTQSLLVYQTDGDSGFYYHDGANWVPFLTNSTGATGGWTLKGNTGTTAGTNFIGTTDVVDWVIKTNDAERIRVLSGGNVGIGTSTPNYILDVIGQSEFSQGIGIGGSSPHASNGVNSAGGYQIVGNNALNDQGTSLQLGSSTATAWNDLEFDTDGVSAAMIIKGTTGNVGIGTTTPTSLFNVFSSGIGTSLVREEASTNAPNAPLKLVRSSSGGAGANGIGTRLAFFAETTTEGVEEAIGLVTVVTTDATTGSVDSDIRLEPYSGGTNVSDAFTVTSDGYVGIGTTTPTSTLVLGNDIIRFDAANSIGTTPDIYFKAGGFIGADEALYLVSDGNGSSGAIVFGSGDSNTTGATEHARIRSNGHFGLGTNAPTEIFHITAGTPISDPPTIKLQAKTESGNTSPGDVYGAIEFGVLDGENNAGTQEINAYIKAVDTRTGTTSFEDAGLAFGTLNNVEAAVSTKMTLTHNGDLGIGTTAPGGQLELSLDEGRKPSTTLWTTTSDERLKTIKGTYEKGLQEILRLSPIVYQYKNVEQRTFSDEVLGKENVGFSAQAVQEIFPECVGTDADGFLNLNPHAIMIAYVNAIKELNAKIEVKQEVIGSQNSLINSLKAENEALKAKDDLLERRLKRIEEYLKSSTKE